MSRPQFQLGGQALIEGVMMRGPRFVGAAVRRADGSIETRVEEFNSILKKRPYLNLPFVRGIFALVEMMKLGTGYLNWSSNLALEDENAKKAKTDSKKAVATFEDPLTGTPLITETAPSSANTPVEKPGTKQNSLPIWLFLLTILGSLGLGALLFVATPNLIAHFVFEPILGNTKRTSIMALTFIEGAIKLCIFIAYVYIIGRRKQIKRVFEYHGAEHKVVYAAENNRPITPDGARPYDTPHPRCGTGFALLTVVVSIVCYSFLPWPENHFTRVGFRLCLLPVVAGISYEILKATVNPKLSALAILVVKPGMWLQRLTTEQPNDEQLEVACAAMQVVIDAENKK